MSQTPDRSSRYLVAAAAMATCILIAAGCSKKSSESDTVSATSGPATTVAAATTKPPGTSSTSTTESTTSSTSTTSTSAPTAPATAPTTPEGYATALVDAWQRGDHVAAAAVATPEAVDQIFAQLADHYTLDECSGAAGSTICSFTGPDGGMTIRVRNLTGGDPMLVIGVQFF